MVSDVVQEPVTEHSLASRRGQRVSELCVFVGRKGGGENGCVVLEPTSPVGGNTKGHANLCY